ncbi:MAG TPA: hypothetical protein VEO54_24590 [Thermoanaerobaculia bacterium]|nr:hypothetical protein [Thermoanaerobaculia bacterium]
MPQGTQTIRWIAAGPGTIFPESNYFEWKMDPPPLGGALPSRSSNGQTLELTYNNTLLGTWEYGLTLENSSSGPIIIDPEIDNGTPPPPYEGDDRKKG